MTTTNNDWLRGAELAERMVSNHGYEHAKHYIDMWISLDLVSDDVFNGFHDFLDHYNYYMEHCDEKSK